MEKSVDNGDENVAKMSVSINSDSSNSGVTCEYENVDSMEHRMLEVVLSYPVLSSYETQLRESPFHVQGWILYLTQIEELVEELDDEKSLKKKKKKDSFVGNLGGKEIQWKDVDRIKVDLQNIYRLVGQKSVTLLPKSYKLWIHVLNGLERIADTTELSNAYEACLYHCHKYPRIWQRYAHTLWKHNASITKLRRLYNRALVALPVTQHDRIWPDYLCALKIVQPKSYGEETPVLSSLPTALINQQHSLGPVTLAIQKGEVHDQFGLQQIPNETKWRVFARYVRGYDQSAKLQLAQLALNQQSYGQAAELYVEMLNDASHVTTTTSRHDLWLQLCQICTNHPQATFNTMIDFPGIIRTALHRQNNNQNGNKNQTTSLSSDLSGNKIREMEGTLWNQLAQYHTVMGQFEMARGIYEEGMQQVTKVRDFSILFDQYIQLEEQLTEAYMQIYNEQEESEQADCSIDENDINNASCADDDDDINILLGHSSSTSNIESDKNNVERDLELALARAENLMARRPLLLNRVYLKQNPHVVSRWLQRCKLFLGKGDIQRAISTLEEAVMSVNPRFAQDGTTGQLYIELVRIHQHENNDLEKARKVYEQICTNPLRSASKFHKAEDWAQCYASYVEFELGQEQWDKALQIVRQAVNIHNSAIYEESSEVSQSFGQKKMIKYLYRNLTLWNLLFDLEESLGTMSTTKDAYNAALERKVATPSHVLHFAAYLRDLKYFEESFTAYEKGVELFSFESNETASLSLWKDYLDHFVDRYKGTQMARTRELYDRCLSSCPPKYSTDIFLSYGRWEEQYGLTKRALSVYERMCTCTPASSGKNKFMAYQLYIAKTLQYMGVDETRPLYERAIAALEDNDASEICIEYANMETSLKEYDRARAIFTYGAQLADPRLHTETYYKKWHEFEVSHGNEETFREMLRIKRSVMAAFSTVNYNAAEMGSSVPKVETTLTETEALAMIEEREGVQAQSKERISGFVQGKRTSEMTDLDEVERRAEKLRKLMTNTAEPTTSNEAQEDEDEIDLDEDDEEEERNESETKETVQNVSTKTVPLQVFGGLAPQATASKHY